MVKADYKRDYYADLEVPSTADNETIKKKFRELAKQYHPDRNPGREAEVVPKFQAIQAAHEILGDPTQKAKYDSERAKLNRPARETDSPAPAFKKPPPPRRTDSGYANGNYPQPASQPPPRRDPSATGYGPQSGPRRPDSATSSANDKFAQFARAAPPQQRWDQAKFDEAARAEAYRGMNAMRGGGMPQTSPLRSRGHPTAPRPAGAGSDSYTGSSGPSPGYPGLGRTASGRRFNGPGGPGDEPQSRSAYAQYHRSERDRPPSTGPYSHAEATSHYRPREPASPSRTPRPYPPEEFQHMRPPLSRTSSKYAHGGGERTTLGPGNIGRSASVRTSPIDKRWEDESGPFGARPTPEDRKPRPRHRSHSPSRPGAPKFQFSTSESSSEGEDSLRSDQRSKATPRSHTDTSGPESTVSTDDGLGGYFPKTNYNNRVVDDHTYAFPAPEVKATPLRQSASHTASPYENRGNHDRRTSQEGFSHSKESHTTAPEKGDSQFSAEHWHDTLGNQPDMFSPPDSMAKDRKSPTKTSRPVRPTQRNYAATKDARRDAANGDMDPNILAGMKQISPDEAREKASAFQSGRLPSDFAEKVNGQRRGSRASISEARPESARTESNQTNGHDRPTPDEMDIDSPAPSGEGSAQSSSEGQFHVTVEEEHSPSSDAPHQNVHRHYSGTTNLNLDSLAQSTPFTPSETGLKDLTDLSTTLPFASRPAEDISTTLHRTPSSTLRDLNLPRPPKPAPPLDESSLDQHSWKRYGETMTNYMHDWNKFNNAMIEHFRARQEAVTHGMYRNWVCAQGDGASADNFVASGGVDRAGYATYMTWLEDDRKCRTWWDVAFEEHRVCMEGLGKVRRRVKELSGGS